MYLLQADSTDTIAALALTAIISLLIMYFVIKAAVHSGTKEMREQMILQNNLKMQEMIKNGHTKDDLKVAMEKAVQK